MARLNFTETRYEGPTGITGVLHHACARAGLDSASLWAPVPHYVATVPSPKAALALIERVEMLLDVRSTRRSSSRRTEEYEQRLDAAVAAEPDVKLLVERLEAQADEAEEDDDMPLGDLPSGDSIAREFQRFLREQGREVPARRRPRRAPPPGPCSRRASHEAARRGTGADHRRPRLRCSSALCRRRAISCSERSRARSPAST